MCGIVGYAGSREATSVLVHGLRRLEYRGYDSAGVAIHSGSRTEVLRCRGKLAALEKLLAEKPAAGTLGVGHTRWATHGRPSDENAHPHRAGSVSVVHNGIVENHTVLRDRLKATGREFTSQTDTEVIAHLVDEALDGGATSLAEAVRAALAHVEGSYAIAVISQLHPDVIVAAKYASPLVLGIGKGEMFVASDAPAILEYTRDMIFLEDGDVAELGRTSMNITGIDGKPRDRPCRTVAWTAAQAEKAGYAHFMLKEIYEQPEAVSDTLRGRLLLDRNDVSLDGQDIGQVPRRLIILACGTSYYAGLVGKFLVETLARIPCEVDLSSEFRYKEAKARGARALAICNVVDSAIARVSDWVLYTHAGLEIGVASTKCFTAQLAALYGSALPSKKPTWFGDHAGASTCGELPEAAPTRRKPSPTQDVTPVACRPWHSRRRSGGCRCHRQPPSTHL